MDFVKVVLRGELQVAPWAVGSAEWTVVLTGLTRAGHSGPWKAEWTDEMMADRLVFLWAAKWDYSTAAHLVARWAAARAERRASSQAGSSAESMGACSAE